MFGSCKSISGKYSIFRKGKYFHVFGYISKKFLKNIFWRLEKKKEKTNQTNPEEGWRDRTAIVEIAIDGTIAPLADRPRRRSRSRRSTSGDDRTARRSTSGAITPSIAIYRNERRRSTSALVGRSHCSSIAPLVDRCSPIWALSLSLSLSGNELK